MAERPSLDKHLDSKTFREFYYLKEELVDFCRKYGLPVSGLSLIHIYNETTIMKKGAEAWSGMRDCS